MVQNPPGACFNSRFFCSMSQPRSTLRTKIARPWSSSSFQPGVARQKPISGLIAFTLLLRRMRHRADPHAGLGVSVILRYTLRLLTLDQLERATALICALEVLRRAEPKLLGDVRFTVGLWVGRSATANTMRAISEELTDYKNQRRETSPCPLEACPWCGSEAREGELRPATHGQQARAARRPLPQRGRMRLCEPLPRGLAAGLRRRAGLSGVTVLSHRHRRQVRDDALAG